MQIIRRTVKIKIPNKNLSIRKIHVFTISHNLYRILRILGLALGCSPANPGRGSAPAYANTQTEVLLEYMRLCSVILQTEKEIEENLKKITCTVHD